MTLTIVPGRYLLSTPRCRALHLPLGATPRMLLTLRKIHFRHHPSSEPRHARQTAGRALLNIAFRPAVRILTILPICATVTTPRAPAKFPACLPFAFQTRCLRRNILARNTPSLEDSCSMIIPSIPLFTPDLQGDRRPFWLTRVATLACYQLRPFMWPRRKKPCQSGRLSTHPAITGHRTVAKPLEYCKELTRDQAIQLRPCGSKKAEAENSRATRSPATRPSSSTLTSRLMAFRACRPHPQ